MKAVAVVRKHMFACSKSMLAGIFLFENAEQATEWMKLNPVDELMDSGNVYQYEMYPVWEVTKGWKVGLL